MTKPTVSAVSLILATVFFVSRFQASSSPPAPTRFDLPVQNIRASDLPKRSLDVARTKTSDDKTKSLNMVRLKSLLAKASAENAATKNEIEDESASLFAQLPGVCFSELPGITSTDPNVNLATWQDPLPTTPHATAPPTQMAPVLESWNPHSNVSEVPARTGDIDPHAELYAKTSFPSAQDCATCHKQLYEEWAMSSHAYAAISPMFHAFEQKINDLSQGTVGYFCLRCHAPVATTAALRRDQSIVSGPKVFREGVTCIACHRVKTPYTKSNGERRIEPGDIHEPVYGSGDGTGNEIALKYSEFFKVKTSGNSAAATSIHRQAIQFEEISESTFCASCHQVAVQPGIKLEVVWDQYRASPAYREGTSCQDCHMGKVPGRAEGYTVGPAAVVNDKVVNPERKHSNHVFYGPGYPITHPGIFPFTPESDRWTVNEWLLFDWQAGWGTQQFENAVASVQVRPYFPPVWQVADDRFDAREIVEKNIARINYKKDLRRQILENGSQLDGPFFKNEAQVGQPLRLHYCLTNTNRGHNLPSGSLGAQPQVWLNVVLIGPDGGRLWESGYLDSTGDLADYHSKDVLNKVIPFDDQLFNLQTKFLTTNVKGTDREMYLPINVDIDQLPFLRPAPQPVTTINHPPLIRMEAHSLPPTASKQARYTIPGHLLQQPGTYRLTVRMRSRSHPVYFMQFCNATPEMMKAMVQEAVDFHVQSSVFEVR
jgi:Cytochrome c554 and c-prime